MRMKLQRIMVTTDFSPTDREVVGTAVALAARFGIPTVTLYHAHAVPTLTDFGVSAPFGRSNDLHAEVEKRLSQWSTELSTPSVKLESLTTAGRPAHAIIERSVDFDLIVIGSRGSSGLRHFLLGSTTDRVVQGAHCDVWVVRVGSAS